MSPESVIVSGDKSTLIKRPVFGEYYSLCQSINAIVELFPEITRDEIYADIEEAKKEPTDDPIMGLFEGEVDRFYTDRIPFQSINEVNRFCWREFPCNSKKIYEFFKGTEVFPVILEALGIMFHLSNAGEQNCDEYYLGTYYQGLRKQDVVEWFGEWALKHYDQDRKLTEDDYEYILNIFCEYLDFLQETESKKRLEDLVARLAAYRVYFLDSVDPKDSELQLAKCQAFSILSKSAGKKLTDTEENILEALGNDTLRGQELLKKAGYNSSSHYRTILSNLVKRGILKNDREGYQKS